MLFFKNFIVIMCNNFEEKRRQSTDKSSGKYVIKN